MAGQTIWRIFIAFLASITFCKGVPQGFITLEKEHNTLAWKEEGWILNEPVGPHKLLKLTFALKQRNLQALEQLFWRVSDPSSTEYGKYRSLQDLVSLVAPSKSTKLVIRSWLQKNRVDLRKCNSVISEDFLTCEMSCEAAETMLQGTKFYYFNHDKLSGPVIRSINHYSVPEKVAPHLDFVGGVLRFPAVNWARPKVPQKDFLKDVKPALPIKDYGIHIGVYPSVLREHYKILDTVGSHPNNSQVVAQFLGQFYSPADLSEFFKIFGSTFEHLDAISKVVGPDTGRSGIEASLDTQYIMSTGANISTWFWSTADRHGKQEAFLEWMVAVSNMSQVPWVHSISYGDNEDSLSTDYMKRINVEFQKAGVRGLSLLFASGDDGANCIDNKKFRPSFPASSPFVTAVGGTAFVNPFTQSSVYAYGISGGGFSNVFAQESYQTQAVSHYLKTGPDMPADSYFNKKGRAYPDIAAICNHFWVVNNLVPVPGVLGTSASTPSVAGIISLLNDLRFKNGKPSMGFLNPFLYKNSAALVDVTTGHNEGCDPGDRGFTAAVGWDPVTGNGSPNYQALAKAALNY
jgi:tripeptidyl-peptidase-1